MRAVQREGEGEARRGEEGEKDREGSIEINANGRLFMVGPALSWRGWPPPGRISQCQSWTEDGNLSPC